MVAWTERRKKELKNWLYALGIFFAITLIFTPHLPILLFTVPAAAASAFVSFIFVGFMAALFSAFILTPIVMRKLKPLKDPALTETFEKLVKKAGMGTPPTLTVTETPEINAVAYNSILGKRVGITRGLIEAHNKKEIDDRELEAILAHELGHHRNLDCLKCSFVFSIVSLYEAIGYLVIMIGRAMAEIAEASGGGVFELGLVFLGGILMIIGFIGRIIAKIASTLAFHFSRKQEYGADAFSAELMSSQTMANALTKIDDLNNKLIAKQVAELPYTNRWQVEPVNPSWIDKLFHTHPPTEKRVNALLSTGR